MDTMIVVSSPIAYVLMRVFICILKGKSRVRFKLCIHYSIAYFAIIYHPKNKHVLNFMFDKAVSSLSG